MSGVPTLVFGATGRVGSATALEAHKRGLAVSLALRDTAKAIPALDSLELPRVRADFKDPASVAAAVEQTGAKRAFIYVNFESDADAVVEALVKAGVEFVVLLSSATLMDDVDIRAISPQDFTSFVHAKVEVALDDKLGAGNYVAVRPAYFASNAFWWTKMVRDGEVKVQAPRQEVDWIVPKDIGRVSAGLLAGGPGVIGQKTYVNLMGPELITLEKGIETIANVVGKEVKIKELTANEMREVFVSELGFPPPLAAHLTHSFEEMGTPGSDWHTAFYGDYFQKAKANVRKYSGYEPTTLREWAEENKAAFMD
jgi:uncharacterized protein YbjT (DUF2867 family)